MGGRSLFCALLTGFLLALSSPAQEPTYLARLTLPVAGDTIASAGVVEVDPGSGEVLVVDGRNQRILIFDQEGLFRFEITGGSSFSAPGDLAVDRDGFIFLLTSASAARGQILQLDFDGQLMREIELNGLPPTSRPPELASVGVVSDGSRFVLLDGANNSLWITDRDGRILHGIDLLEGLDESEIQDFRAGQVDVYGDRILVALTSLREVACFDLEARPCGRAVSSGGGECGLLAPTAAALDSEGNYLIIDQQRMILLRWDPAANRCLDEHYGLGEAPGYFYFPYDLALDSQGRLYVAQSYQGRVQVYGGLSPAAGTMTIEEIQAPIEAVVVPAPRESVGVPRAAEDLEAARAEPSGEAVPQRDIEAPSNEGEIRSTVRGWAEAWAEKRVEDYLAFYGREFVPPSGLTREAWESQRRRRLARPAYIQVRLGPVEVARQGEAEASARFTQVYESDRFRDEVVKRLDLTLEEGSWKIQRETVVEIVSRP